MRVSRIAIATVVTASLCGCGSAAILSKYGPVQYVDIHFMDGAYEITGGHCVAWNAEGSHNAAVPGKIPVGASFSTLLVKCDAPGVPTGYADAGFAAGYPAQLLVRPGQERQYAYDADSFKWNSSMVRFTDAATETEANTHSAYKTLHNQVAAFAGAGRRAAEASARQKAATGDDAPPPPQ